MNQSCGYQKDKLCREEKTASAKFLSNNGPGLLEEYRMAGVEWDMARMRSQT